MKKHFLNYKAFLCGAVMTLALPAFVSKAEAAAGDLDLTFGARGKVTTDFSGGRDAAKSIGIQLNGKIVAAGVAFDSTVGGNSFALARYNRDGSLDARFGNGGKVMTHFIDGVYPQLDVADSANSLAIQWDGKILAAGAAINSTTGKRDFALLRYKKDGSLDANFGNGGMVATDFGNTEDTANAVVLQPNGKIVVAGTAFDSATGNNDFALARYHRNGSLDTSFGNRGKVITHFNNFDEANAAHLTEDGKILVAGVTFCLGFPCTARDFVLLRYNSNGSLDTSFGDKGKVTTDFRIRDMANAIDIAADGKIILAGFADRDCSGSCPQFALARYNRDGTLDTSFGDRGRVITGFGRVSRAQAAIIQRGKERKIIVAGYYRERAVCGTPGEVYPCDFAIARYNWDGSLDTSFGNQGKITTDFGGGTADEAFSIAIQWDGKIVLGGNAGDNFARDNFALARYLSE